MQVLNLSTTDDFDEVVVVVLIAAAVERGRIARSINSSLTISAAAG
jgi:hypothetical protein